MMEDFKFYEVGGKIRDEFLGIKSKDVDYVAVPSKEVFDKIHPRESQPSPAMLVFDELKDYLEKQKFEIFLVTPRCYTIRAKFPEGHKYQGIADFVMARKEVGYIPGTRTPIIYPGTLYDDLSRRDFTVNALAKDPDTGASRSSNYKKLWIVDIDSKDDEYRNRIVSLINECRGVEGDRIKHIIPTVNGYHLISNGFDRQQFSQKLALYQLDQIDIHDNNPTLLYYKTLCQNLS